MWGRKATWQASAQRSRRNRERRWRTPNASPRNGTAPARFSEYGVLPVLTLPPRPPQNRPQIPRREPGRRRHVLDAVPGLDRPRQDGSPCLRGGTDRWFPAGGRPLDRLQRPRGVPVLPAKSTRRTRPPGHRPGLGLESAQTAGEHRMAAFVLVRRSVQAIYDRRRAVRCPACPRRPARRTTRTTGTAWACSTYGSPAAPDFGSRADTPDETLAIVVVVGALGVRYTGYASML
jgi:ribosomal protein L37AE/L43A